MTVESMPTDAQAPPSVPTPAAPTAARAAPAPAATAKPAHRRELVYAIGRIEPRFPSLGIEKEFAQATAAPPPLG